MNDTIRDRELPVPSDDTITESLKISDHFAVSKKHSNDELLTILKS